MKTLVAYFSQTGNTEKVAEAIYNEVPGEKRLASLEELEDLEGYDIVLFGFPVHAMGPAQAAGKFLDAKAEGKKVALFVTHGAPEDEADLEGWLQKCREAASSADLVGFFHCQGEVADEIAEFLKKSDDPKFRAFGERAHGAAGQPDEGRLEMARGFAREVLKGY